MSWASAPKVVPQVSCSRESRVCNPSNRHELNVVSYRTETELTFSAYNHTFHVCQNSTRAFCGHRRHRYERHCRSTAEPGLPNLRVGPEAFLGYGQTEEPGYDHL